MNIKKGLVYAIIPARSGSTSIKDKNIKPLASHPLIAYSIVAAKLTQSIDRIIVSTDSEKYAKIANKYGAETPYIRPSSISGKYSTDYEFMDHAITWFDENEHVLPEYWVHLRPTSPLRNPEVMEDAIQLMKKNDRTDCLRSVHPTQECPYKWFNLNSEGFLHNICDLSLDEANGPRQKYPQVYVPNGYIDVLKTNVIIETHTLYGTHALPYVTPKTPDIDYQADFDEVSSLIKEYASPIINELNGI